MIELFGQKVLSFCPKSPIILGEKSYHFQGKVLSVWMNSSIILARQSHFTEIHLVSHGKIHPESILLGASAPSPSIPHPEGSSPVSKRNLSHMGDEDPEVLGSLCRKQ